MQVCSTITVDKIRRIGAGQGRNSEVYLAYDPQLGGQVALKEIPVSHFPNASHYFTEAQIIYANSSPRVVPIQYACSDPTHVRIVMPYLQNGSLQDKLDAGFLTSRETITYAEQFLTGVHHVHANGYVHFDIKPSNILFHNDGSALLSDFGQTMPVNHLGVANCPPIYLTFYPPEVLALSAATRQADMYQIGLTLYRMVNGDAVFRSQIPGNNMQLKSDIQDGRFPRRNLFLPHVPTRLKTIIRKLLKVNPSDRYQTVLDLKNELGQVDKLLDWRFTPTATGVVWYTSHDGHDYQIVINSPASARWDVTGHTIRKIDGVVRKRNAWCGGPFRTFKQAETYVAKIFRDMEG